MIVIRQALTIHARRALQRRASVRPQRGASASDKENSTAGGRPGKRRLHNVDERSVLSDASQESGSSDDSGLEARSSPAAAEPASPLDKEEVVLGLVDVVAVLWTSRLAELSQQVELLERLQQAWSRVLPLLFSQHKDSPAGASLLYVASLLPHAAMAPLSSHCLSALRQLPDDAPADRCAQLLDPLVNWGRGDDVIELCDECLRAAFDGERSFVASQKNLRRSAAGALLEERLGSSQADSDRDELAAEMLRTLLVLALALAAAERPDPGLRTVQNLLQWGHRVASEPARWPNTALLARVSCLLTDAALNSSLTGCLALPLAEATVHWLLLGLSGSDADLDVCVASLFHAADLLEATTVASVT
ncbi:uncharacterized protein LOC119098077 [Pollicipes pollicipes]|uniref:uncharacterized protein LOC119098077 n=1 Tax=Pollicipes pollicipes TaxID=41117 RepID=UPI001884A6BE|nr:uncharacterized protein LOC119098077 [Pollicipes pollicipes]